ncbi:MAG TPA: hypothetical protein VFZ86_02080, partial [Thermoleophilia bacterium]|nr:hypothetical protein [Thermoleophilia bacterium]
MSAAAASDGAAPKRLSGLEQRAENLHRKIDRLAQRSGKVKRSPRLRGKVLRTNALVKRMNRGLIRLGEVVLTASEVDDAFVAEVLACNAAAAHLDRDAIRLSRRTLKKARSRAVSSLSQARTEIIALSAKLGRPKKPSTPAPTPTATVTPTPTAAPAPTAPAPTTGNPISTINNATSGQTVVCPAGTFTGDVRVPSGVTVIGQGMDRTRIVGSLTWGSNTTVRDLAVGGKGHSHEPATYTTSNTRFERVRFFGGG